MNDQEHLLDLATLKVWEATEDFLNRCPDASQQSTCEYAVGFGMNDSEGGWLKAKLWTEARKAFLFHTKSK